MLGNTVLSCPCSNCGTIHPKKALTYFVQAAISYPKEPAAPETVELP